jgi:hypothetical protein
MKHSAKYKLLIIWILIGLVSEYIINWTFPFTGLAGLICYPMAIISSIIIGLISIFLLKRIKTKGLFNSIQIIFIISQLFILTLLHPQDGGGGTTFNQIHDFSQAFRDYDNYVYEDFPRYIEPKRIAYIYKFQNQLPDFITIIVISDLDKNDDCINPRKYLIENYDNEVVFDQNKLLIKKTDSVIVITENPNDSLNHRIYKTHLKLFNSSWSTYESELGYALDTHNDDFELYSGIDKIFYVILKMTKKPAGNNKYRSFGG